MPGPGKGAREELWTWDLCTHATEADIPHVVYMLEDTLKSKNAISSGTFQFEIGARTNGRHILSFDFVVQDEGGEAS
ncbi:clpC [Symbiodinium pilosum]|uniref:ClpC protein n=1 Tax=Symbiodinium pilosum TaxID=2952 RepID=A0A812XM50_SYMPI|nr:clpC [Symbiodinium pilosum]